MIGKRGRLLLLPKHGRLGCVGIKLPCLWNTIHGRLGCVGIKLPCRDLHGRY